MGVEGKNRTKGYRVHVDIVGEHHGVYHDAMVNESNNVPMLLSCHMGGVTGGSPGTGGGFYPIWGGFLSLY